MRALPYAVGSPARTTIVQLGEMAFMIEELGIRPCPIAAILDDCLSSYWGT